MNFCTPQLSEDALREQLGGAAKAVMFILLMYMLLLCYLKAIFTDPGEVPNSPMWAPTGGVRNSQSVLCCDLLIVMFLSG